MSSEKIVEHLRHILFAASAAAFILMGLTSFTVVGTALSGLSFLLFWFLSYKIPLPKLRDEGRRRFFLVPVAFIISLFLCRQILLSFNTNSKMAVVFSCLHLDQTIFGVKIGALIFSFILAVVSSYVILCCLCSARLEGTPDLDNGTKTRRQYNLPDPDNDTSTRMKHSLSNPDNGTSTRMKQNLLAQDNDTKTRSKYKTSKSTIAIPLLLLIVSFVFTLCNSKCSPLLNYIPSSDYSIFYIIGKKWSEGYLPYVDMFDHKGPLIFFIYMIGYVINDSCGVYFLQTVALWCSLCFAYKIVSDKFEFHLYGVLVTAGMLLFLRDAEFGYALTEEFNLPFLMISTYLVHKYLKAYEPGKEHPPVWAAVHGAVVSTAFCLRLTNAVTVVVWVAFITIILLINRQFKNLLANAFGFLAGFCAVFVPFAIYFACNGAFYDMIYGTLIYNIYYAAESSTEFTLASIAGHIVRSSPAWLLVLLTLCFHGKKNRQMIVADMIAVLCSIATVLSGNAFGHYALILAVFVPVDMVFLADTMEAQVTALSDSPRVGKRCTVNWKMTASLLCTLLIVLCCSEGIVKIINLCDGYQEQPYEIASKEIVSYIPAEEAGGVL